MRAADRRSAELPSPRLALVQWNGGIGGAEVVSVALARSFRRLGVESEFVFVTSAGPLADRLAEVELPFRVLGLRRGRDVLRHPRAYGAAVAAAGPDGALLPECGFVGGALRLGGYRAPIVAVEHGTILQRPRSMSRRLARQVNKLAGAWADDTEIGVSEFVVERMRTGAHARHILRIYNGIDPAVYPEAGEPLGEGPNHVMDVGFAGRLIPGKGADDAIEALARASERPGMRLLVAGDGPERTRLAALARDRGVSDRVEFLGLIDDVRRLWERCEVAIFPSHEFIESFGMAALEAMACGKPVVATRNGAAPELVLDGVTGTVVTPGDVGALADALVAYADSPELRREHGAAGRARAAERFHIDNCATAYLRCFGLAA